MTFKACLCKPLITNFSDFSKTFPWQKKTKNKKRWPQCPVCKVSTSIVADTGIRSTVLGCDFKTGTFINPHLCHTSDFKNW